MTKWNESLLLNYFKTNNLLDKEIRITEKIIPNYSTIENLKKDFLLKEKEINNKKNNTNIKIIKTLDFIKRKIGNSTNENIFSKLIIPNISNSNLENINNTIYGYKDKKFPVYLSLQNESIKSIFSTKDKTYETGIKTNKNKIEIYSNSPIGEEASCIIDINLNRVDYIKELILNTTSFHKILIYYRDPIGNYILLKNSYGSKITTEFNVELSGIKIVINGIRDNFIKIEELTIVRYYESEEFQVDIPVEVNLDLSELEILRCGNNESEITYLISTNNRPFKNATKGPIFNLNIEDGEIYTLHAKERYTLNMEEFGVFNTGLSQQVLESNIISIFSNKNEYIQKDYGGIIFYETYAIYRDSFNIKIPDNKFIYINNTKVIGNYKIYPGVYIIKIPEDMFDKKYDFTFYKRIEYIDNKIRKYKNDSSYEEIISEGDIFALIDSTASFIFGNLIPDIKYLREGNIEVKSNSPVVYLGYRPIKSYVSNAIIRLLFKRSPNNIELNHLALKII